MKKPKSDPLNPSGFGMILRDIAENGLVPESVIKCAPEMLDLLERLDLRLSGRRNLSAETKMLFAEMRELIKKARGES